MKSLANRVRETSVTTGTGSITLAGAAVNSRTFTSVFAANQRLNYFIETATQWETGVGYLSDSTTLVREQVEENSNGDTNFVSLVGGSNVFVSFTTQNYTAQPYVNFTPATDGTRMDGIVGELSYGTVEPYEGAIFVPCMLFTGRLVAKLSVQINVLDAGDTNTRVALYDVREDGKPGNVIVTTGALAATATGPLTGTVTSTRIPAGAYYMAALTGSATVGFKGVDLEKTTVNFAASADNQPRNALYGVDNMTSFTDDPAVVIQTTAVLSRIPEIRTFPS